MPTFHVCCCEVDNIVCDECSGWWDLCPSFTVPCGPLHKRTEHFYPETFFDTASVLGDERPAGLWLQQLPQSQIRCRQQAHRVKRHPPWSTELLKYTVRFKKSFTTLKAYMNLFRGHAQCFELSQCSKRRRVLPGKVTVQCDFHW
jgi:hypothetical protein